MIETEVLDERINLRLDGKEKESFHALCATYDVDPPDMLREIISAFNNKRLNIIVTKSKLNTIKGLHHVN